MSKTVRPYSLLKPAKAGQYGPRSDYKIADAGDWWMAASIVNRIEGPIIVDFETTGLNIFAVDFRAVGIAIAGKNLEGGIYFSLKNKENAKELIKALCKRNLVAHNVCYDAAVLEILCNKYNLPSTLSPRWPWKWDTISMYFHLSQHEWMGQSYGLKAAQIDVLGWKYKGDVELDEWLAENGLGKGDMWQAPDSILGKYGCYDVQATYQLFEHLIPQLEAFPDAVEFISQVEVPYHYRSIVEMRFHGIKIDVDKLAKLKNDIDSEIESFSKDFLKLPEVASWAEKVNKKIIEGIKEPPKYKKDGKIQSRYTKYLEKINNTTPESWFNINSKNQMRDLFFNHIYSIEPIEAVMMRGEHRQNKNGKYFFQVTVNAEEGPYIHEWKTKVKNPEIKNISIDKDILPKLGPAGISIKNHNKNVKFIGYINGMLESLDKGVHHGNLKPLGTITGRAAGVGGINLQQIPKDKRYLECFVAREGYSLIDADVTALEPGVICELSGCPTYNAIYNSGKKNDIYLYILSKTEEFGDKLISWGYDPDNPDWEIITWIKDNHKSTRDVGKVLQLMSAYKAGGKAIYRKLINAGVKTTLKSAYALREAYWSPAIFGRVKEWDEELLEIRNNNKGWLLDGLGIPVTISKEKKKDIMNSVIQSTGHRILVRHIANIMKLRDQKKVPFHFWIADIHDQTTVEVLDRDVDAVLELFRAAEVLTNEQLGGDVYFKIEPEVAKNFVPFKL